MRDHPISLLLLLLLAGGSLPALAEMPLETSPTWESTPLGHFATGGAWADIDRDGWLDMVVANGNDMGRQQWNDKHKASSIDLIRPTAVSRMKHSPVQAA